MRNALKKIAFTVLDATGAPSLSLKSAGKKPRIFLYHGVSPEIQNYGIANYRQKFIRPESFREHLVWMKKRFKVLPLFTIIERLNHKEEFDTPACAVTFDDGYQNLYHYAFPVLKELRVPATVFLTTDLVDQKGPLWVDILEYSIGMTTETEMEVKEMKKKFLLKSFTDRCKADALIRDFLKKIPNQEKVKILEEITRAAGKDLRKNFATSPYHCFTWDEMREMEKYGIEFAPHTLNHPILSRLDQKEAEKEIKESSDRLKIELKNPLPIFAYPNGQPEDFTDETILILKKFGFVAALTTVSDTIAPQADLFRLPRFSLDGTDDMALFRITASGLKKELRSIFDRLKK